MKVAHLYACKAKKNSGDFLIGPATKNRFKEIVKNDKVSFIDFDIRADYTLKKIQALNDKFDAIIIGSGGLILPDTIAAAGSPSGWQWKINDSALNNISIPIYVISIGYNTFFEQTMGMTNRNNNRLDKIKKKAFISSISLLVKKSTYFSMRHRRDIEKLINDIGEKYLDKVSFEFCPTIAYTKYKSLKSNGDYIAFEIKDDRLWRRCYKIGEKRFYSELLESVKLLLELGEKVVFLSHDGSSKFYKYLKKHGINIPMLSNTVANEDLIYANYIKIKAIVCTAGHSQMISSAIEGIRVISLITHPKLINFCRDTGDENYVMPNRNFNFSKDIISKILSDDNKQKNNKHNEE